MKTLACDKEKLEELARRYAHLTDRKARLLVWNQAEAYMRLEAAGRPEEYRDMQNYLLDKISAYKQAECATVIHYKWWRGC